jgi:transposase-like protein
METKTARKNRPVATSQSRIVRAIPAACADEATAVEFVEQLRWGSDPACPRCGDTDVAKMMSRDGTTRNARYLWRCHGCKRQFTVRIGTVFEDSPIPMRVWCYAFWKACSSKKGISALQISRETGLSYKSALFLMHRIRFAMAPEPGAPKLSGVVEADETYVGGKPRNRTPRGAEGPNWRDKKTPVFAVVERGGKVRAMPLERVTAETVKSVLFAHVEPSAKLNTDESTVYVWASKPWEGGHETVNHSAGEYVRGSASTNSIEGFFSLIKRGIYGTFHSVSKKHLHRYVDEFAFRHNTRTLDDGERTEAAIRGGNGRRFT